METCICGKISYYLCIPCGKKFCKNHRILHEENKEVVHTIQKMCKKLPSQRQYKFIEDLSSKIKCINECEERIVKETETCISHIQNMCLQALNSLKVKKHNYVSLLNLCQKSLLPEQVIEIERESKLSLTITVPVLELTEINQYYTSKMLSESEKSTQLDSMELEDAKVILQEYYGIFLEAHTGPVYSLAITSDNKFIISGGEDKTVRIWNLQDRRQVDYLQGHKAKISSVIVSGDSKYIATGSWDLTIIIWKFQEKTQKVVFRGHKQFISSLVFTNDNETVVSGSWDFTIRVWSIQQRQQIAILQEIRGITCLAISNDNKSIVFGADDLLKIWNFHDKTESSLLKRHYFPINSVAISSDNKYIIYGSHDTTVGIWNLKDMKKEDVFKGHSDCVNKVIVTSDNSYIISGSSDKTVIIWSLKDKSKVVLSGHTDWVKALAITSDNNILSLAHTIGL